MGEHVFAVESIEKKRIRKVRGAAAAGGGGARGRRGWRFPLTPCLCLPRRSGQSRVPGEMEGMVAQVSTGTGRGWGRGWGSGKGPGRGGERAARGGGGARR